MARRAFFSFQYEVGYGYNNLGDWIEKAAKQGGR
jgi:hypothetical protein